MIDISVVIPTYQRRELVLQALLALNTQTLAAQRFEVIVAIDGSFDGTHALLSALHPTYRLHILWQENRGRAAACNLGVKNARGDIIVLLDDDMQPSPQFLEAHLGAHVGSARRGVIGAAPVRITAHDSAAARYVARKFNQHLEKLAQPNYAMVLRDFYSGNFSIHRDVLLSIGLFNESFTRYGNEDLELSLRLRQAETEIRYCAKAIAFQHYPKNFAGLARDTLAKGQTAVQFAHMHPEAVHELKLPKAAAGWSVWPKLRDPFLRQVSRLAMLPDMVAWLAKPLEWAPIPIQQHGQSRLLDLCYWTGVYAAQQEQQ